MTPDIETLLEQDLRKLTAHPVREPDLDAITRRGRALRRRRMALAGAGGATGGVAAAVAIALAVGTAGQAGPGRPGSLAAGASPVDGTASAAPKHTATDTPPPVFTGIPSAAELKAHLTVALSKAMATSELTVRSTFNGFPMVTVTVPSQNWQLETDKTPSGAIQQVVFTSVEPGTGAYAGVLEEKTLTIDYGQRYAVTNALFSLDPKYITDTTPWYGDSQPESLQSSSWSKVTGTATVDGQPAYVLAQTGSGGYHSTVWVSKKTLLPIKDVVHTYVGTTYDTYTWSAASGPSATAAANVPAIPPGFTRIKPAAGCPIPPRGRQAKYREWGCRVAS
jgi:hypothetical protein